MTYILGINAFHGDASATLLKNGEILLAVEEERLNRQKHCAGFPILAIQACLDAAGISIAQVNHIAISTDPSANLRQKVIYGLSRITKIGKMLKDRLGKVGKTSDIKTLLASHLNLDPGQITARTHHVEHHLAHLSTAYFSAPFDQGIALTLDGMGDFVSAKWARIKDGKLHPFGQVEYPHSIGYLYTATTQYLGFPYYGDEGKVMGLAPYGQPIYLDQFRKIITLNEKTPGYKLNLDYFTHHEKGIEMQWEDGQPSVGRMYSDKFIDVLGPARQPGSDYDERVQNIAASMQRRVEEIGLQTIARLAESEKTDTLFLAGGVALNSVMNGKIRLETPIKNVYIHPNAGDGGTSLGAAQYVWHQKLGQPKGRPIEHAYLGHNFSNSEIEAELQHQGLHYEKLHLDELVRKTAQAISESKVVGWFQDRMEWGPRALGSRSIVADPRNPNMKDILNARIKKRESFRPFAPSILEEHTHDYFEQDYPAPAMLMVYQVRQEKRSVVPAITHVDGSGRLQTVRKEHHPRYYALISAFNKLTGVPIVLNTSFNENEPIVCTPTDAIACFMRTKMDVLAIGDFYVKRCSQSRQ